MEAPAEDRAAADEDIKRSIETLFKEADGRPVGELLARHNRERLFVRPLLWDHRQPALLQCRFLPRKRPAPPLPTAVPPPYDDWESLQEDEESLAKDLHHYREYRDPGIVYNLLECRYPVDDGWHIDDVNFFYGRRPLCHVGYVVCIVRGVCFLEKSAIQSFRDRLVSGRVSSARKKSKGAPSARRRFAPPTSMPDPYIAAVCIALAQSQKLWDEEMAKYDYGEDDDDDDDDTEAAQAKQPDQDAGGQERTPPAREAQDIPVVVVVHEGEHLTVFTADVTPAFLAKLDDPRKPPSPGASMDIHQQRVKFLPYETFAGRFAGAVRDTRHRRRPGDQGAGQSSSAGQEGKGSALLCSASDSPLPLRTVEEPMRLSPDAKPGEADTKRKHSDGADQRKADNGESRRPPNKKKRR